MNRLIIIGNGFDIAHGLQTKYSDFIDWYWDCWWEKLFKSDDHIEEDELCLFKLIDNSGFKSFWELWNSFPPNKFNKDTKGHLVIKDIVSNEVCEFKWKSELFKEICKSYEINNWVDIENIFYQLLCSKVGLKLSPKMLNDDLDIIRAKLFEYLNEIQKGISKEIIIHDIFDKLYEPIKKQDVAISSKERWNEMLKRRVKYSKEEWQELIGTYRMQKAFIGVSNVEHFIEDYAQKIEQVGVESVPENSIPAEYCFPDRTLMLNFNYTTTADSYFVLYSNRLLVSHIHGDLSNLNSMIFGYGDEMDEHYRTIVNKNDNDYLINIKSNKYLEASNYI